MGMTCMVSALRSDEMARVLDETDNIYGNDRAGMFVSLEKAWHGLHYLLTGSSTEGDMPLSFLLLGGEEIGEDLGYGPARLFHPEEVKALDQALQRISAETLWSRFDPEQMSAEGVYPDIWDEPETDLREEYVHYFQELKGLVKKAAAEGWGLLVTLC